MVAGNCLLFCGKMGFTHWDFIWPKNNGKWDNGFLLKFWAEK